MSIFFKDQKTGEISTIENPISLADLDKLQTTLYQADISNFLRQQAICIIDPEFDRPIIVRREYYTSAESLQKAFCPEINLHGNPWLYRHLTMTFDRRVLSQIDDFLTTRLTTSIHLNINLRSILSSYFRKVLPKLKKFNDKLIFELDLIDILAHPEAFLFARELLHQSDIKVCIDGVQALSLSLIQLNEFETDYIKIFWSEETSPFLERPSFRSWLDDQDPYKVILCRCDTSAALDIGSQVGINLFQGRKMDEMIAQEKKTSRIMV